MAEAVIFKGKGEKKTTVNSFKLEDTDAQELNEFLAALPHPPSSLRDAILLLKRLAENNAPVNEIKSEVTADERLELERLRHECETWVHIIPSSVYMQAFVSYKQKLDVNESLSDNYWHVQFTLYLVQAIAQQSEELKQLQQTAQSRWAEIQARGGEIDRLKAANSQAPSLKGNEAIIAFTKEQVSILAKARRIMQVGGYEFKTDEPAEVLHAAVQQYIEYVGEMASLAKQFSKFEGVA